AVYSDLDFLVLGYYLEALYEKELVKIWEGIQEDHHLETLHFCVNNKPKFSKNRYAPTEKCPWRKKVLQGEVHDDNTWSLLGVSSHAGLFGSIHDVSRWGRELRRSYYERGKGLAPSSIVRAYCRRSLPVTVGDWGYGFMKPSRSQSSAGKHFSASSVGHTGFTGTSFWWDPQKDLMIVILSNRVHPSRKNQKFVALRPLIHDWIVQIL
ncbi:MAG: serine hydrolase, partial [Bdellovibrionales bacterium]|nr:serine hydrolase [Bdellovibrionales bacterium]